VIVLDTHAWLWYASEDAQLSKQAKGELVGQTRLVSTRYRVGKLRSVD
jgi:PIN domain nuclease of toxin-antitoxin system